MFLSKLDEIRASGSYKRERVIMTPQGTTIRVADGKPVLNLCANNYLGLAQHPAVAQAARERRQWAWGWPACDSSRHSRRPQTARTKLSEFLGPEETIFTARVSTPMVGSLRLCSGRGRIISDELIMQHHRLRPVSGKAQRFAT